MATSSTYCTHRDLEDIFPNVNDYDSKEAVYGWEVASGDKYRARNPGLVTQLFVDGRNLGDAESNESGVSSNNKWYYDSAGDTIYYYGSCMHKQRYIEAQCAVL